jgi:cysteine synthase A
VRIFAKLHSDLPAKNVKSLPALNMLRQAGLDAGLSGDSKDEQPSVSNIVEYSSGSTVISLAIIANIFGLDGVTAYLSNKVSSPDPHDSTPVQHDHAHTPSTILYRLRRPSLISCVSSV